MHTVIDQFKTYHGAISGKFNAMGPINVSQDRCFHGMDRAVLARQMMQLAQKTGETDPEALIDQLRPIYLTVAGEITAGLPSECRQPLIEAIIAEGLV